VFLVPGNIGTSVGMFLTTSDFLTAVIVPVSSYCFVFYILYNWPSFEQQVYRTKIIF